MWTIERDRRRPGAQADLGVYLGAECKGAGLVPGYGAWLGRPQDRGLDFLSNETWEIIENASGREPSRGKGMTAHFLPSGRGTSPDIF